MVWDGPWRTWEPMQNILLVPCIRLMTEIPQRKNGAPLDGHRTGRSGKMLDEETRYKENSASFEQKGWWLVDREALTPLLPDGSLFLPATDLNGIGNYWTGTKRSDGKRWQIHITDDLTATDYTGLDEYKRAVRPVFLLSDLEE
jgi:hypothetical protein